MNDHQAAPLPHTAEHWDERYSGTPVWSGNPNHTLIAEASDLPAGRALDVGCGEGADAVWLALRGWNVTALDISHRAVERTEALASASGVSVTGVAAGLLEASLPEAAFDLVSAMYPALLRTTTGEAETRMLDLVAPGGTLLIVHHADVDRAHALAHGCDPDDYVGPDDVLKMAVAQGTWDVITHERRERPATSGAGAHHRNDLVVRLLRR